MSAPPDVFLSYGHSDIAAARRFAEAFEREGLTVWWDAALRSGEAFDSVIEAALEAAKAAVVLWSATSVQSRWVRAEATLAERSGKLVPVMIESCRRPIMFELTHTPDLSHWTGNPADAAWQSFAAEVRQLVAKAAPALEKRPATPVVAPERTPSIAVLPFANMSGDKEQEYFSDGLAEEIINALAQVSGLKVIARTSAFAFRGQNTDIRRIADTLGVTHVLEGSVRRSGNRIRVTAQLIIATDGTHLWSERYDRELADVFAVQDEISAAISAALKVRLSHAAVLRHTPTLPAYEALLKARHFHWKATHQSMEQARVYYEQAIALDPKYALAHVLYADFVFGRATVGLSPLREAASASRALAQRALELEPSLVDAHAPLCVLASTHDYDWKEAGRQFALAMADGQALPHTHMTCGLFYLLGSGRRDEAVKHLEIAVRGDPLHLMHRTVLGICLGAVGRHAEVDEIFLQSMDLDPGYFWTRSYLAFNYAARQMFAEALPLAETSFSLAPQYQPTVGVLAGLLVRMGQPDRAREVLATLGPDETYGVPLSNALFHTCCGEIDLAADWYGKAIEERDARVLFFLQGAIGESIRRSPRWPGLAAMANLPEAAGLAT